MYRLTSASGGAVDIHPSRVVRFYGARLPRSTGTLMADEWSDSIVETINASVRDATATQQGIANLVQEASVDIWRIEGLMNQVSNADYRKALNDRMMLVQQMKGMVNATVMDKGDEWSQKTANFSQLPEVINRQLQIVSGAVDIPATRFLGQSPAGLNSTGDSDIRNYYDRLGAEQKLFLRPALQKIMDALVPSVLGAFPEDLWFDFPSLWQISEKERAEIGKLNSESADIVMRNNLVPGEVMAEATLNQMIESGNWPGLEAAYEQWQEVNPDSEFDLGQGSEEEETPDDENVLADAKPRTLYVRRKLLNADEVIAWAKSQGFTSTLPAEDMHVTLIYSRAPVDWMKMGQPWEDALEVPEGGPRLIEEFDSGAVVLLFGSSELQWRHERMKEEGASFDYPEYQPHITLAYEGAPEDIDSIEPYRGVLKFGPEIFEEVDEDWKQGIKEKA